MIPLGSWNLCLDMQNSEVTEGIEKNSSAHWLVLKVWCILLLPVGPHGYGECSFLLELTHCNLVDRGMSS